MSSQQDILSAAHMYNYYPNEERLQILLSAIEDYYRIPPENQCSWCGKTDSENEDDGWGPCVDVTVKIADSEEGWAEELRWVCNDHLIKVSDGFIELGFVSHRHGGVNFLEDRSCPGYHHMNKCPTPEIEE